MFDTTDQILNQLRTGENGLQSSRAFVSATAAFPNTEDLAGELGCVRRTPPARPSFSASTIPAPRPAFHRSASTQSSTGSSTSLRPGCEPPIRPILRKVRLPAFAGEERHVFLVEVPARPLRAPHVRRALLPARQLHQASASAPPSATSRPGARPPVPATRTRVRVRRAARPRGHRRPPQPATASRVLRALADDPLARLPPQHARMTSRDEHGVDRPTVAGLLTLGTEPTDFHRSAPSRPRSGASGCLPTTSCTPNGSPGQYPTRSTPAVPSVAQFMRPTPDAQPRRGAGARYDLDVVDEAILQCRRPPRLRHLELEDPPPSVRRPSGALQPRQAAQHHHSRRRDQCYTSTKASRALTKRPSTPWLMCRGFDA